MFQSFEKTCTTCGETKPLSGYYRSNWGGKFGHTSQCKVCAYERLKAWKVKKKQQLKEVQA